MLRKLARWLIQQSCETFGSVQTIEVPKILKFLVGKTVIQPWGDRAAGLHLHTHHFYILLVYWQKQYLSHRGYNVIRETFILVCTVVFKSMGH